MNNPNPQIQKIIYQSQCAYLYWYVFLALGSLNGKINEINKLWQ